jgi:hypothetical protein
MEFVAWIPLCFSQRRKRHILLDNLYLDGKEQETLRWAIGCTVGELSGRLFPLIEQEQSRQHPAPYVRWTSVLQKA